MTARDPVINLWRQLMDASKIIPEIGSQLDPLFGPKRPPPFETPMPPPVPDIPMIGAPPSRLPDPVPEREGIRPEMFSPDMSPGSIPFMPRGLPGPRAPDRPPDLRISGARSPTGLAAWLQQTAQQPGADADRSPNRLANSPAAPLADPLATLLALVRLTAMRDGPG